MSFLFPGRGRAHGRRRTGLTVLLLGGLLWLGPAAAKGPVSKGHPLRPASINFLDAMSLGLQPLDGKRAWDFSLPGIDGKTVRLGDFRGKVVILSFWASWCPACRMEMPTLEKIHKRYKDRDLAVVSVSIDAQGKKPVVPLVKKLGLTFPILLDPGQKVMDRYGVTLIPTAFIIGRNGEMIGKAIGPKDWDGENGRRILEKLLDVSRAASPGGSHSTLQR
jgi:peroxiredoxin